MKGAAREGRQSGCNRYAVDLLKRIKPLPLSCFGFALKRGAVKSLISDSDMRARFKAKRDRYTVIRRMWVRVAVFPAPTPCYGCAMPGLCRACLTSFETGLAPAPKRCPACRSPRLVFHPELTNLSIAHMDCDAFYASVEKRDHPEYRDVPLIVGGGMRGVVSTCCYIARIKGVRSAMPMFQALKLCPEAAVVRPRMAVYAAVSREIRAMMEALTPAIEPLSLDEAFLDLTGTSRLHGAPPAVLLAGLVKDMEAKLGITGSIGLSHNKFLAKIASDLDKPRGFSVIGHQETEAFLLPKSVAIIWGVGAATRLSLEKAGIRTIADLRRWDRVDEASDESFPASDPPGGY